MITENHIESLTIEKLDRLGYHYIYGPDILPEGITPERESFSDVILNGRLSNALRKINDGISEDLIKEVTKALSRNYSGELVSNNEEFHRLLTEGVPVTLRLEGEERGDRVWLIDFENPYNNEFIVCNQFTVVENNHNKRPDIVLFINGLPLIVIELKNPVDENATAYSAFKQLETYKVMIPQLFNYNAFGVISDGLEAKAGTISAGFSRFMSWKTVDGKTEASKFVSQLETLIDGMLNKETVIDLIRHFIVYEKTKTEDKNGITTVNSVKKMAAYHQYYAVNKAVESTLRATGHNSNLDLVAEDVSHYGLKNVSSQGFADRKGGVVWHTQGSGKSLSMVFYTGKIVLKLNNPTILIITDRNDLDDQLFDTFAASKQLLRQDPVQAEDRTHLKELLRVASGGVVFTTIQKFQPDEGNVFETLSERENIVVIADEAHRTQYGFRAKTIDEKDENGNIIGKKIVYGFAKYMRDALPKATYLGFTGTPIENTDVNTPAVFGNYVDIYDIAQAVEDGATVRIYYESRLAKIEMSEEGRKLVQEIDEELQNEDLSDTQKAKAKWTQLEALIGSENRVKKVSKDIVSHFENRQSVFEGKVMVVAMSRRIAADLYEEIIKLKPEWHSDDLNSGKIKVVMTSASSDGPIMSKHNTTKDQRRKLAERMKNPLDELKLVIVRDMWLTGFDAPSMHTLYIDKPMKGHNLMQAIARVNRVYKDKPGGLVVDYLGIASDLEKALSFYADSGGKGDPTEVQEKAVELMLEKIEIVSQMFHGFDYQDYFDAETSKKLSIILSAEDHILGIEDGKKRYIDEVTALDRAFALSLPHDKALDAKDEIAFFQAIKSRLSKFNSSGGKSDIEIETTIRQVIDKALVTDQVIDIFDAAGLKKPDISILSEDFLDEIRHMKQKNVALEVLKKLLNDEIKSRSKTNLVKSKSLMEMLEQSIRKYHNKILTAAEVIEELINLSKEITDSDKEANALGLTEYEYAFYTAVASNESALELLQQDRLKELAIVLTETIRNNTSIDWTIRESVKARLKIAVKRILRKFGYPPDMQMLATETVLRQAEMLAKELTSNH